MTIGFNYTRKPPVQGVKTAIEIQNGLEFPKMKLYYDWLVKRIKDADHKDRRLDH